MVRPVLEVYASESPRESRLPKERRVRGGVLWPGAELGETMRLKGSGRGMLLMVEIWQRRVAASWVSMSW
jgi:hypothetical protein